MPDVQKVIEYKITGNPEEFNRAIKDIENTASKEPIQLRFDIDTGELKKQLGQIKSLIDSVTVGKDKKNTMQIAVAGMPQLRRDIESINKLLGDLSKHFTSFNHSVNIKPVLQENNKALSEFKNNLDEVINSKGKSYRKSFEDVLAKNTTKKAIGEMAKGEDFYTIYDSKTSDVSRLVLEMAKLQQESDGWLKTWDAGKDKVVTIGELFNGIVKSISGKKISDFINPEELKGLTAKQLDDQIKSISDSFSQAVSKFEDIDPKTSGLLKNMFNVALVDQQAKLLTTEFNDAVEREKLGKINVSIDNQSISELSNAIGQLKAVFPGGKDGEDFQIGIKSGDVEKITAAFSNLQGVLENIHKLLQNFDIPLKMEDIPTPEDTFDDSKIKEAEDNFNRLSRAVENYKKHYDTIKSADFRIVQERSEGSWRGTSVLPHFDDKDIRLGKTTKTSIKRELDRYLQIRDASEEDKSKYPSLYDDGALQKQLNMLSAYVFSFKDINAAQELFGKKNQDVFQQVVGNIEKAKISLQAFKDSEYDGDFIKNALAEYGIDKMTYGQSWQLSGAIETGGYEAFASKIKELFGVEIPTSIEQAREAIGSLGKADVKGFFEKFGTPIQALDKGSFENYEELLKSLGGRFAEINTEAKDFSEQKLQADFFSDLIQQLSLTEDQLTVVKAALQEVYQYVEGGKFRTLAGVEQSDAKVSAGLSKAEKIIRGEYSITDADIKNAKALLGTSSQGASGRTISINGQSVRQGIEDALKDPFDITVNPQKEQLREMINGEFTAPFEIDITPAPKENLHDAIDALINGSGKYRIDLDLGLGGGSGKQNPYELISDMMKADEFMARNFEGEGFKKVGRKNVQLGPLKERAMYFNTETGFHTNPFIFDKSGEISDYKIFNKLSAEDKKKINAAMHSHPEQRAYMSIDNYDGKRYTGDFLSFLNHDYNLGIKKGLVTSQRDVQIFDIEKFLADHADKFGNLDKTTGLFKGDDKKQQKFLADYSRRQDAIYNSVFNNPLDLSNFVDYADDKRINWRMLFDTSLGNRGSIQKALIDSYGATDPKDLSNIFFDFLKQGNWKPDDSMRGAFREFIDSGLRKSLGSSFGDVDITNDLIREAVSNLSSTAIQQEIQGIFNRRDNGDPAEAIRRWASDKAFAQMGVADFAKNYNQFIDIDKFKDMFPGSLENIGDLLGLNFDGIGAKIQESITSGGPYNVELSIENSSITTDIKDKVASEKYPINIELSPDSDITEQIKEKINGDGTFKINVEKDSETEKQEEPNVVDRHIENGGAGLEKDIGGTSVDGAVSAEEVALDRLKTKIDTDIPNAIQIKNEAFNEEMGVVQNAVQGEIECFNLLESTLTGIAEDIAALDEFFKTMGDGEDFAKPLQDGLTGVAESLAALDDFFVEFRENVTSTFQVKDLKDTLNGFKISKANVDNMVELSAAIEILADTLNKLETTSSGSQTFSSIGELLSHAEELKNLATILSHTNKEREKAAKQSGAKTKTDSEQAVEYYDKLARNAKRYLELQKIVSENGIGALSDKQYEDYQNYQDMWSKAEATAKQYDGTLDELTKAQERYNNRVDELNRYQAEQAENNQASLIADTQKRLNKISTGEQQRWAEQYSDLVKQINLADAQFKETGNINEYTEAVNQAFSAFQQFSSMPKGRPIEQTFGSMDDAKQYFQDLVSGSKTVITDIAGSTNLDSSGIAQWTATVRDAEGNVQKLTATYKDSINQMVIASQQLPKQLVGFAGVIDSVKSKIKQMATYWTARLFDPYRMINNFKKVINVIKEYDSAMMEIRKVSQATAEEFNNIKMSSFDVGKQIGSTGKDILSSVAAWKRLGKSLEESQEAAKASNWLLNVSEFTNIDDATKSLVSITQAFDDLSYESAIDKLNGVGDAFSSSTDQIASGMQNVASVLQVAGNNVDQSIALLAAANDVTQDMSKASMGVRTVALRIAGTQDAKQQLEDMGEDTSDFVVQTTSKVDQKVRNYTKTSATPNGISVLDEKGRLRDTYSILLDIAKVWDKIVEKDNQFGTNTSNALLELLAGKTRSNVLASILQAPEVLERAYETSRDSAGVGQRELDIYMDSIQAKTTQLTNSLQELANITINSEAFKTLLDIINSLLNGVNQLAKGFGVLNTVLGGIAGFVLQKRGLGILPTAKGDGWGSLLKNFFSRKPDTKLVEQEVWVPLEESIGTAVKDFSLDKGFMEQLDSNELSKGLVENSDAFQKLKDSMSETELQSLSTRDAISKMQTTIKMVPEQTTNVTSAFSKLTQGITSLFSTALTSVAISFLISAIGKGIDWVYNDVIMKQQNLIKKGKEAQQKITEIRAEFQDKEESTNQLGERYNKLRTGVSYKEGNGYSNISLSNEEFKEFLDINQQLVDLYPQLRSGTDAQGNSYVNLGSNAEKATESLQNLLNAQRELANKEIGEKFSDQLAGVLAQNSKELENISENEWMINSTQSNIDAIQNGIESFIEKTDDGYKVVIDQSKDFGGKVTDAFNKGFGKNDIDLWDQHVTGGNILDEQGRIIAPTITYFFDADTKQLDDAIAETNRLLGLTDGGEYDTSKEAAGNKSVSERQIKDNWESLKPSLMAKFTTTATYKEFSETIQNGITQAVSNVDLAKAYEAFENQDIFDKFDDYLKNRLMYSLSSVYDRAKTEEDKKAATKLIEDLFTFDPSNLTDVDMMQQLDDMLDKLFHGDEELKHTFKVALNFEVANDDGTYTASYEEINNRIYDALGGIESKINREDLSILTQGQKNSIIEALDNDAFNFQLGKGFDDLINWIKEYQQKSNEVAKTGTLSDIFKDEIFQTDVEGYEKNLTSLTSALETLRTEGSLAAEQMRDLQEEFPQLTDFSTQGISKVASQELSNWIDQFKSGWTDFSDEGKKQLDTYLANFITSYRKIAVTQQDAQDAIKNSILESIGGGTGATDLLYVDAKFQEGIDALHKEYGEDLNWSILLTLQDQFSGDTDALIEKYRDYKLVWELEVETEKVQETIDSLTADRNKNVAQQQFNESLGISMSAADYEADNAISDGLIASYEKQLRRAKEKLEESPENVALQNKIKELEQQILGERTNKQNNYIEQLKIPRTQLENIGVQLAREVEDAEREIANTQNIGNIPTQAMYQGAIDRASEQKSNLEATRDEILAEIEQIEQDEKDAFIKKNNFKSQEQADAAWEESKDSILQQNSIWQQFMQDLDSNQSSIDSVIDKIRNWGKEMDNLPLTKLQNIGAELARATSQAEREITNRQQLGGQVTKQMYQSAIDAARNEKDNLVDQQDEIVKQMDDFQKKVGKEFIEKNGRAMTSEEASAYLEQNDEWKQMQGNYDSNAESLDNLTQKIYEHNQAMKELPFRELEYEGSEISRTLEKAQADFEKREPTAQGYLNLMGINEENIENIEEQIHRRRVQLQEAMNNGDIAYGSDAYYEAKDAIAGLEDQLISARDAQTNFAKSLLELPGVQAANALQKYKDELAELQNIQEYNATRGIQMTDEDYEKNIQNYTKQIIGGNVLKTIYSAQEALYSGLYGANSEQAQTARSNKQSVVQDIFGALTGRYNTQKERNELPVKQAEQELSRLQSQADILQSQFDQLESKGIKITTDHYQAMSDSYDDIIKQAEIVRSGWFDLRESVDMLNEDGSLNTEWIAYNEQWVQASTALDGYIAKQRELDKAIKEMPLTEKQNEYADLQTRATQIEEQLDAADARHQKTSEKLYMSLIKNGNDQINNLKQQRDELVKLRNDTQRGSTAWRDYQSQIDDVDSSIASMSNTQLGYYETMTSLISTNANELASVLSSAFSEINSGTGLTIDTMNELKRQFSDLAGYDVSSIFYETADGMKMNADAAEVLVDAEYQLQVSTLKDTIEQQKNIIDQYGDSETAAAQKAVAAANQRIDAAQRELSMLQALYDEQKKQFSDFQQWQNAESTANAGDRYNTIQSALKDMKEAYDKGLTGTDEFRKFTAMINEYGSETVEAYEKNIEKIKRYFTEDATGLSNFIKDAVDKGYGSQTSDGYTLAMTDMDQAAHDLGITTELLDILLGRAEDYGAYVDLVNTEAEGQLKVKENMEDLVEAKLKYNKALRDGASDETVADLKSEYDDLLVRQEKLKENTQDVAAREGKVTASDLRAGVADYKAVRHMYQNGEIDEETFMRRAQQIADETHIKLTPDLMMIDESEMQKAFPDYNEVKVTPVLAENADISNLAENGDTSFDNIVGLIKSAYDETEGWDGEISSIFAQLEGYTGEDLDKIVFGDGTYQNEALENALDSLLTKLGLGQEQGTALVGVLKELFGLEETEQTYSTRPEAPTAGASVTGGYERMAREYDTQQMESVSNVVNITEVVTAEYESGAITPEEIQQMSVEQFNAHFNVEVNDEELQQVKDTISELSGTDGFDMVVKLDQSSIDALTTTDKTVSVDTGDAQQSVEDISKAIEDIPDGNPTVQVGGNYEEAKDSIRALGSNIDMLHDAFPQVNVAGNFDAAKDSIRALFSNIEMLHDKTITVTTNNVTNGKYAGTMLSPTHASGTAYNMLNMRNITGAFANGKVDLEHDEEALVNELGTESIVRDGQWFLIPGGMHVEALKKGDIVLNHLQTADLIQHGKAFGRGKAFAQGSGVNLADLRPVAPAHGSVDVKIHTIHANDNGPSQKKATDANTKSTKANTAAKDKETKATENTTTALEKFQNWAQSFMDWIEVRINRFTQRMELNLAKMENAVGYNTKNKYVDKAMADNNVVLETSQKAIGKNGGYIKHLKKVVSKAQSAKLVTKNEAERLIGLIEEGGLTVEDFSKYLKNKKTKKGDNSSKTENRVTAFIDEYQKWYEKILGCRDGIEQCIAKQKELQQTKLDNIVEQYESLASYAQAISASSQAMVSLHQASGFSESNGTAEGQETRQQFANQIALEHQIGNFYQDEMAAYAEEMKNALTIFGADSNEYRAAKTAYEGMNKAFIESKTNVKELTRQLYDLNLKPMEHALNRLQAAGQRFADIVSFKQARGTMKNDPSSVLTELNFTDQIQNANSQIAQLTQRMEYNRRIQEDLDYATDSAKWDELQKQIEADEHSIAQLTITNEQLKDSIRELRWKEFDDLQKKVTNAISDFDHLRGLFNEEEFFDDDGEGWNLTKEGKANIALLGAQIMETRNQIADYREALNKVNEEYDNGVISQEEYEEYSRNMVETIQKLVENTENYKDALIDLYKTQITNENEALQKNIKLRQDALSKQREYYEYSKKLTDQQKDRNKIVAQINALQGNANLSARAQVARLREQLAEAEEGLDSTRRDHRYDILNEGYSKLSEDAQESLDKTLRHVAANARQQEQIVEMMLNKVKGNYDEAYGTIQQRIADTGTVVSQTADQCMKDGPLQLFFENLDSKTITPKNNWDQFITATTQKIDTSAIDEFVTHLGEKLSDAKRIAQETARALADAAKQQSSSGSTQGSADNISNNNSNNSNNSSNNNNNTNTGLQQDKVVQILKTLKKGKSKTGGDVGDWIEKTFGLSTTSGIPTQLASALGINVSKKWAKGDSDKVLKALKAHLKKLKITDLKTLKAFKGYKRGTLGTLEDELAFTHEGEIIRRSDGAILRQLPAGTQVIPKIESENLLKWAQIDPFKELKEGFKGSNQITNTSNNAPVFYYDSVIHIDGNVDADMMDRVEQLGKALLSSGNFQKGVVQKVTQEYKREFNKRY